MPPQARRHALLDHLRGQLARVLGSDPLAPIELTTPLRERGLDSLMSVELRNLLAKSLKLPLPHTLALDYPTLDALCEHLLSQHDATLHGASPDGVFQHDATVPDPVQPPDDAAAIVALSEADAEAMLRRELESLDV
jgi:acyl carrier protein